MPIAEWRAGESSSRKIAWIDRDPKLLFKFSDERGFRGFARFDLAAGKFPQPRQRFACRTPLNQYATILSDQRRGDNEEYCQRRNIVKGCATSTFR